MPMPTKARVQALIWDCQRELNSAQSLIDNHRPVIAADHLYNLLGMIKKRLPTKDPQDEKSQPSQEKPSPTPKKTRIPRKHKD